LREHLLSRKCQIINEELAYNKNISCPNIVELRNLFTHLYKIKYKWKIELRNYSYMVSRIIELISIAYISLTSVA
jgi:hypothetical protein